VGGAAKQPAPDLLARSGPAARKLAAETGVDVARIEPTGKGGRVTPADIRAAAAQPGAET